MLFLYIAFFLRRKKNRQKCEPKKVRKINSDHRNSLFFFIQFKRKKKHIFFWFEKTKNFYLLDTATLSNSSLFLNAYELGDSLAALISSSAKHSAMVLMFRKADSRAPVHNNQMAWLTRLSGETSTAWRLTVPARPILVESSLGPLFLMASTKIFNGFLLKWIKKNENV